MPHRTLSLVVAVTGVVVVCLLLLARRDVYSAALRGPHWRCRLLAAGLALLGLLGLPSIGRRAEALPPLTDPSGGQEAGSREWSRVVSVWSEAEAISSGQRGPYPFNTKAKEQLLKRLAEAAQDIDAVAAAWKLSSAEVSLLKKALARLTEGVQQMRPTEMMHATCYSPIFVDRRQQSLRRLEDRLPLLEKAAAARRLRPEVIRRALADVKQDLAMLEGRSLHSPEQRKEAEKVCKAVRAKIAAIEAKIKQ